MTLTEKEVSTLTDIAAQMAITFKAKGITEPTPEQISEVFIAQCKRNIELCQIAVYGYNMGTGRNHEDEQKVILSAFPEAVYNTIRNQDA